MGYCLEYGYISLNKKNEDKSEINYKKSLGQNFLYDTNLLNAIIVDGVMRVEL